MFTLYSLTYCSIFVFVFSLVLLFRSEYLTISFSSVFLVIWNGEFKNRKVISLLFSIRKISSSQGSTGELIDIGGYRVRGSDLYSTGTMNMQSDDNALNNMKSTFHQLPVLALNQDRQSCP